MNLNQSIPRDRYNFAIITIEYLLDIFEVDCQRHSYRIC